LAPDSNRVRPPAGRSSRTSQRGESRDSSREDAFGGKTETGGPAGITEPRGVATADAGSQPASQRPQTDEMARVRARQRPMASTRAKTGRHRRAGLVDGRYELEEMISKGGMGRVFRARHRDLGRKVALKLVLDGFQDDQELREIFFKEARLASSLSHPNIINVTDFGLDDDLGYFVVMDLLEGDTLRERARQKRPNLRFAFDVLDQATGAVRYIHGRDIIHCDLKPENIFLARMESEPRRANIVKLLDFGLSWRAETMPDPKLGGTPPYLAPERLRGQQPSPLCDVYSLGMILYELIAGRLPYQGTIQQMIDRQLNGALPDPPSRFAAEPFDERADQLVMRALSRNPSHRHPSTEAFQFELRAVMGMMGMKVRRHVAIIDSTPTLDAELTLQAVLDSPVSLAIFNVEGSVRIANRAFIEACEGVHVPVANFNELAITRRDPELQLVFQRAVEGKSPVTRVVLAGPDGGEHPRLLWVAPLKKDGVVSGVHMTVVVGGSKPPTP
jgi:serine/threonine protein kinase